MSADLAVYATDPSVLDVVDDPGKAIELACQRANAWLKVAIADVRIETIVETKAQAAALAAFAVQKQLGKDAELAALEVQRRAERGVGLAIRRGQESGEIAVAHETRRRPKDDAREPDIIPISPADYFSNNQEKTETYAVTDDVTDEQFNEAIDEAKAEGNLSRANVVRKVKVKGEKNATLTTTLKVDRIRELAGKGWASAQIARDLGNGEEWIRRLAAEHGIEIRADKVIGRTRRINSNEVVERIVADLANFDTAMRLVDFDDLDAARATEWANSLTDSIRALNRFTKQIKELAQ